MDQALPQAVLPACIRPRPDLNYHWADIDQGRTKTNKDKLFVPISAPTAGIRPKKFIGAKTLQNTLFGTNKL